MCNGKRRQKGTMQDYSVRKNINGSRRQNRSTEKERQTIDGAQTRNCEEVRRTRRSDKKIERRARTKDGQCVQVTDDYLYSCTIEKGRSNHIQVIVSIQDTDLHLPNTTLTLNIVITSSPISLSSQMSPPISSSPQGPL